MTRLECYKALLVRPRMRLQNQKALTRTEEGHGVNDGVVPRLDDGSVPVTRHDIVAISSLSADQQPYRTNTAGK